MPPTSAPLPRIDHTGGWKDSQYHPRIGQVICARIEAGETVRQVTADPAMPSYATLFRWRKMNPGFEAMYAAMRARVARAKIARAEAAARAKADERVGQALAAGKRPRDWVSGQKSTYRRAWAEAYCERLILGESGASISADPTMPSAKAVYRWLKRFPEFREMYVEARAIQRVGLEIRRDEACRQGGLDMPRGLARKLGFGIDHAARARARWLAGRIGRLEPKVWKAEPRRRRRR